MNHSLYEKFSKFYELFWYPIFAKSFKRVCSKINGLAPKNVLEVGVGPGATLRFYDEKIFYTGIDISESMIDLAQKNVEKFNLKNKTLRSTKPDEYPFDSNSFECLVSFSVISVVPDSKKFFNDLVKLVSPGGKVFIIAHFQNNDTPFYMKIIDKIFDPLTKLFMGFTLKLNEDDLKEIDNIEFIEKFTASSLFGYPLNSCLVFEKK